MIESKNRLWKGKIRSNRTFELSKIGSQDTVFSWNRGDIATDAVSAFLNETMRMSGLEENLHPRCGISETCEGLRALFQGFSSRRFFVSRNGEHETL